MKLTKSDLNTIKRTVIKNDKGLGDTVSRAIKRVFKDTIRECNGCSERRNLLNKKFPYKE